MFNFFWIIPLLHSIYSGGFAGDVVSGGAVKDSALYVVHSVAPSMNIFYSLCGLLSRKLIFDWNWPQKQIAAYTFKFLALSMFLPIIMFFPLMLKKKNNLRQKKLLVIFGLITLILAYLQTVNIGKWGGKLFDWLIMNVPSWTMLRNFFSKVPIAYGIFYSVTLGISIFCLLEHLNKKLFKKALITLLIFIILIQAVPFICGQVNNLPVYNSEISLDRNIIIPEYYQDSMECIEKLEAGRLLTLPMTFATWSVFKSARGNGIYVGSSPVKVFSGKDDFNGKMGFETIPGLAEMVIDSVQNNYWAFGYILGLFGVRYVLFDLEMETIPEGLKTNWLWEYDNFSNKNKIKNIIKCIANEKIAAFGPLSIYKLNEDFAMPYIFVATDVFYVLGDIKLITLLFENNYLHKRTALFFENEFLNFKDNYYKGKMVISDSCDMQKNNKNEDIMSAISESGSSSILVLDKEEGEFWCY